MPALPVRWSSTTSSVIEEATKDVANGVKTPVSSATVIPASTYPQQNVDEVPIDVTFGDVSTAAYRIRGGVKKTVTHRSRKMSNMLV